MPERLFPHCYAAFGLRVVSQVALPELDPLERGDMPFDVEILWGAVDATLANGICVDARIQLAPDAALVSVHDTASFHLWQGRRITIDVRPGATAAAVRFYLLGVVFGVMLVQRGLLALHSSGVVWQGRAVAFMGPSGVGKSTMATALQLRGCPLLFDDACVVDLGHSPPQTFAHSRLTKLCDDSLAALDCLASRCGSVDVDANKHYVRLADGRIAGIEGLPLTRIYALCPISSDGDASIVRLRGHESLAHLTRNVHGSALHRRLGGPLWYFHRCLSLLSAIAVYRLPVRRELHRIVDESARVLEHLDAQDASV